MRNEYTEPEIIDVGSANDVILGLKPTTSMDVGQDGIAPDNELDD